MTPLESALWTASLMMQEEVERLRGAYQPSAAAIAKYQLHERELRELAVQLGGLQGPVVFVRPGHAEANTDQRPVMPPSLDVPESPTLERICKAVEDVAKSLRTDPRRWFNRGPG